MANENDAILFWIVFEGEVNTCRAFWNNHPDRFFLPEREVEIINHHWNQLEELILRCELTDQACQEATAKFRNIGVIIDAALFENKKQS